MRQSTTLKLLTLLAMLAAAQLAAQIPDDWVWTLKDSMPTGRAFPGTCVIQGEIYVIGGATTFYGTTSALEKYNPATDEWTVLENMPAPLCAAGSAAVDGKIYVFGGKPSYGGTTILNTIYRYDPAGDEWTLLPVTMSTPRAFHSACAIGDSAIILIGGRDLTAFSLPIVEKFVPDANGGTWSSLSGLNSARSNFTAGVIDDKIYVMAGIMANSYPDSTVEVYDLLAGGDWATLPIVMPEGARRLLHGSAVYQQTIYMYGGTNSAITPTPLVDAYTFSPYNGFRKLDTSIPELKAVCASAVVGDNLFAIGGALPPFINPGLPGPLVSKTNLSLSPLLAAREIAPDESATLLQNAPNPFAGQTSIRYSLKYSGQVSLQVFDLNGRLTATLFNGRQDAGEHVAIWNAAGVPPGIYLFQLRTVEGVLARKCVVTP
jgi:N-acetylneuraminic acid mutarotase